MYFLIMYIFLFQCTITCIGIIHTLVSDYVILMNHRWEVPQTAYDIIYMRELVQHAYHSNIPALADTYSTVYMAVFVYT